MSADTDSLAKIYKLIQASKLQGAGGNGSPDVAANLLSQMKQNQMGGDTMGGNALASMGGLQGVANLGMGAMSLYQSYQANKMAKQQMEANNAFGNRNVANQASQYNTSLANRYQATLDARQGTTAGANMISKEQYMQQNGINGSAVV